ncbi:iron chelate uptake ABC transporter family permease subunit, partial [Poseidonibacter sp.]|uniref:iron chelate uptake ABC transporter family permease subunit n=1 Tax=Poseidonibacter sp. TaxID=2321188 RepID=UPI003C73A6D8
NIVFIGLIIVAFITSSIVVTIGTIPFIGLIIPNLVSIYRGDNIKNTLLETALLGAFFVLLCDVLGRVLIFPFEVSISIIFSILGSLIFLILVFKGNLNASKS